MRKKCGNFSVNFKYFPEIIMKKIRIACLALLAPLALLCACAAGTPELSIESNWYGQTGERHVITPTYEKLVYGIKFTKSEQAEKSGYYFTYENGTYITELKNETIQLPDGTSAMGYRFSTTLETDVIVRYNGETSETLHDRVTTYALFLDADSGLKPVKSGQEVHSTVPAGTPEGSFESVSKAYIEYDYTIATEYAADLSEAYMKVDNLNSDKDDALEPQKVKLKGSGTYLDNEQLLFALRGVDFASPTSFRSINPNSKQCVGVLFYDAPVSVREVCTFSLGGVSEERTIEAYEFSLRYSQEYSGEPKKFVYAKKTSPTDNVYRNVLLRTEMPGIYSHGNFVYALTSAEFAK